MDGRARRARCELVVLSKGAHPPECAPDAVSRQLEQSLERLQTDHLDLYCLHRDDTAVPVSEWIDALNREVDAGRIKLFGGSNWTAERIDEANAYAAANGLQGFSLLSNNFSLARMEDPVWPGCLASSTDDFRNWHSAHNFPLLPWSAQARGFFLDWESNGLAATRHGADPTDDEMQRVWGSKDNLERRRRAFNWLKKSVSAPFRLPLLMSSTSPSHAVLWSARAIRCSLQDSLDAAQISSQQNRSIGWIYATSGASAAPKNEASDCSAPRAASRSA